MLFVSVFSIEQLAPTQAHARAVPSDKTYIIYCICQSPCLKNTGRRYPRTHSGVRMAEAKSRGQSQGPRLAATHHPQSEPCPTDHSRPASLSLSLQPRTQLHTRQNYHQSPVSPRANDTGATLNPTTQFRKADSDGTVSVLLLGRLDEAGHQ
jgi:hypothetical protein